MDGRGAWAAGPWTRGTRCRLGVSVLLALLSVIGVAPAGAATGMPEGPGATAGSRETAPPACLELCRRPDVDRGRATQIRWEIDDDTVGNAPWRYLRMLLEAVRERPEEFEMERAVAEWRRGARELHLCRKNVAGLCLVVRVYRLRGRGRRCAACAYPRWEKPGLTEAWRDLTPQELEVLRAEYDRLVPTFRDLARLYESERCGFGRRVCEAWAEHYRRLASRYDPSDYDFTLWSWEDSCFVHLSPRTRGLPVLAREEEGELEIQWGDDGLDVHTYRRDPATWRFVVEGGGDGADRSPAR